jgi:putative transposase
MIQFWNQRKELKYSLNELYRSMDTTKQAVHKMLYRSSRQRDEEANLVQIIIQLRKDHPTMCCRDMYYKIHPLYIGRDRFEALCKTYGFQMSPKKNFKRTTDSSGVIRFPNLIENLKLTKVNQVWSSDITYFDLDGVFYYITFIMDNYSRRILGENVSSRLQTEHTSLPVLKAAIKKRGEIPKGVIFHSDGGGQYYDRAFLAITEQYNFKNSMCEYAYQNGKAERLNGVIKNNYLKHWNIKNLSDLIHAVSRAAELYNNEKPHIGLKRMTPKDFEEKQLIFDKRNRSTTKESIDEKNRFSGRRALKNLSETGSQTQISSLKKTDLRFEYSV